MMRLSMAVVMVVVVHQGEDDKTPVKTDQVRES